MNEIGIDSRLSRPRICVLGGGKGGVGVSTIAMELARALARLDQKTLLVDLACTSPIQVTLLDQHPPSPQKRRTSSFADLGTLVEPTRYPRLSLLSYGFYRRHPYVRPNISETFLYEQLTELDYDWIVIDLPSGYDPLWVSCFVLADIPILLTAPEPASLQSSLQFLRAIIFHAIGYHRNMSVVREEMINHLLNQPIDATFDTFCPSRLTQASKRVIFDTFDNLEIYLLLNKTRETSEADQGHALTHAMSVICGLWPRFLGAIPFEERRWFYARRYAPLANHSSDEGLSGPTYGIAKKLISIDRFDEAHPRVDLRKDLSEIDPYDFLGVSRDVDFQYIRQHYRRMWEGYRRDNGLPAALISERRREPVVRLLEQNFKLIQRENTRLSTQSLQAITPAQAKKFEVDEGWSHTARVPPSRPPGRPPSRPAPPTAVQTAFKEPHLGVVLRKKRTEIDMDLKELSVRTRISLRHLIAIEKFDRSGMPENVYLKPYLQEICNILGIDPNPFVSRYLVSKERRESTIIRSEKK